VVGGRSQDNTNKNYGLVKTFFCCARQTIAKRSRRENSTHVERPHGARLGEWTALAAALGAMARAGATKTGDKTMSKTYISCRDGMCGATDCPSCSPHYFRGGVQVEDLEENQPVETEADENE
jgi:hypothetical protein